MLLREEVCAYEYMDIWERCDETLLPDKKEFYSSLNTKDITDVDYRHAKRAYKELKRKIYVNITINMFKVIHY